jgi:pimeloyl-ACP methyl ester carboxylesterase
MLIMRAAFRRDVVISSFLIGCALPSMGWAQPRPPRAAFAGKLTACRVAALDEDVLCGHHDVYEDRTAATGRRIALNVVVLPATTDSVLDDPVVFLAGGGVVPATRYARFLSTAMPALRRRRDVVLVDQRGTGGSYALTCERTALDTATNFRADERFLLYVDACRESLRARADVRLYTTAVAMDDLDDVRAWLGYPSLNLYAASYGTSAATTYVRFHPTRVRTLLMHGVVPVDVPMQIDLAQSAQQSLDRVLDLCASDSACKTAFPDVRGELATVLARFDSITRKQPMEGGIVGQPFRDALNSSLATAESIRLVPLLIHEAATGVPPAPLGQPGPPPAPLGVRLSILCSEGLSAVDTASITPATRGTFLGDFPVRFQLRWCHGWPVLPLPPNFREPLRSTVPALLLTGELDPITPPAYADRVARWFTNSTVQRLPYRSHADTDPCVTGMIEAFIVSGGRPPSAACLAATPAISFTTRR